MHSLYVKANYEEKAKMLGLLASNYTPNDVSLVPKWRKPFSFYAKGLPRSKWLRAHPKNPNFSVNIYAGLNNSKNSKRWSVILL